VDPLLLRKSGSAGNGTRTSGSVARNSDQAVSVDWNKNETEEGHQRGQRGDRKTHSDFGLKCVMGLD
jgi:hypothetical protein